jgi:hypothetical protein
MGNRVVELKESIYKYVSSYGPVLPVPVAKQFKGTTIFISALLSELVSSKRIIMSRAKIGGSPLYYCKHQEDKLYEKLKTKIGSKQKEALDLLSEKKVVRDRDLLPFERVALREMVDFAKPIRLTINDTEELFWRWYTNPDEETKVAIEGILEKIYTPEKETEEEILPSKKVIEEAIQETPSPVIANSIQTTQVFATSIEDVPIQAKETSSIFEGVEEPKVLVKSKSIKKKSPKKKDQVFNNKEQKVLSEVVSSIPEDEFLSFVHDHLKSLGITILKSTLETKNREGNFTVRVPSKAGDLKYYVKARKRKRLNEGDLLLAFTEAQGLKLPLLLVSNANLTKKAQAYMDKNLPGMRYIQLEDIS